MKDSGRFKWGESKQLGDQAIELMANLNEWFKRYLESESFEGAKSYMTDEDKELLKDGYEILEKSELFVVNCGDALDRIEHKLNKICTLVDEIGMK